MGDSDERPVLLIVMRTSGCGKSTFGEKVAQSFSIPFIDGDDLHPKSNVDKMSRGEALTDEDRIPWLMGIRENAIQITHPVHQISASDRERSSRDEPLQGDLRIREMAEVLETSQIVSSGKETTISRQVDQGRGSSGNVSMKRACVIACSALKKAYRDLLRGDSSNDLLVVHLYLCIEVEELERRMHARKNHFMKESMLQSQLAILEEPTREINTITVQQDDLDEQVRSAREHLQNILQSAM